MHVAAEQANSPPVSPTTTLVSPLFPFGKLNFGEDDQDNAAPQSHLSDYPGADTDFYGLPSNPRCIFKTGDAWPVRTGLERILRETRPIGDHPMKDCWRDIGTLICELLDEHHVEWSSIDPVRFAEAESEAISAPHIWIGVEPGTLVFTAARVAAEGCKKILDDRGFCDVEVAFRESVVTQSVGPKLLSFNPIADPVPELRSPFTPTLGIQIAPLKTPYYEGTGAIYLRESSNSDRVFLLTAAHVVRPPPAKRNTLIWHKHNSEPCQEIIALGDHAYATAIDRMVSTVCTEVNDIKTWDVALEKLGPVVEGEDDEKTRARKDFKALVEMAKKKIQDISVLYDEVTKHWVTLDMRVIGYVLHVPTIGVDDGPMGFTRDWALIDLYRHKIDWDTFQGNKVYIGGKISQSDFLRKMHPHPGGQSEFKYPPGGLLQVRGVVKDKEIRNPQQLDANGEPCLLVLKNGKASGVTIGRLTAIESFLRTISEYGIKEKSMEIAVHPYTDKPRGAFSAPGDSGAMVIDGKGRLVGLLTAGSGKTEGTDISYLTPYWWIEEQMKRVFPDCFLYEIVD